MTPNADGPDISQWNPVGDWDLIPQYRLFITKATGTSRSGVHVWKDPTFDENWRQMRRRGFEFRGCYHWLRSDWPMAEQVDYLSEVLAAHGGLHPGEFVMLDWETSPGVPHPTVDQVEEWLELAEGCWPGRVLVYCADWVPGFVEWRERHRNFPLMYPNYRVDDSDRGGWAKTARWGADVWQWTSSHPIPGVDDPTCDMNHVLGWSTLQTITTPKVETMYPDGYGTRMVTLAGMRARHEPRMHPEFARRFFAYMEHKGGVMGVGGGWRSTQPDKPGFAPDGRSFHQNQRFASGFSGYAAVDLVHVVPGAKHRSPTWAETEDAPTYGLHTFIKVPNEPWHIQCIEMRGWQTWVNAGRPDPKTFTLPGTVVPPPQPLTQENDMVRIDLNPNTPQWVSMVIGATTVTHTVDGHHAAVLARAKVAQADVDEGDIAGILKSLRATNDSPFAPGKASANATLHAMWETARLKPV